MNGIGGIGFGGPVVMLTLIALSGLICLIIMMIVRRRSGWARAVPIALLLWSLACLAVITLVPTSMATPGVRYVEACSFDYDGPAPDGFWILPGGQRFLNTAVFVPSGFLLMWTLSQFRRGLWWTVPGLVGLIGFSVTIELLQQKVSRLGRACDITDMVDNGFGAVLGVAVGLVVFGTWRIGRRILRGPFPG